MTKTSPRRRRSHYSGPLAEPMFWEPPLPALTDTPPAGCSPQTAEIHTAMKVEIKEHNARQIKAVLEAQLRKLILLCEHFGISTYPLRPGWSRDLALCLARRHEFLFAKVSNRTYSEIFATFGIEPDRHDGDADLALALALAHKHVPGLAFSHSQPSQRRLETLHLTKLVFAGVAVRNHLQQAGKSTADRQVAKILLSTEELQSIIPKLAANAVAEIVKNSGNDDRGKSRSLSERTLRDYLRQMREAVPAIRAGSATALQDQFVTEVLPLLHHLTRKSDASGAGQI